MTKIRGSILSADGDEAFRKLGLCLKWPKDAVTKPTRNTPSLHTIQLCRRVLTKQIKKEKIYHFNFIIII